MTTADIIGDAYMVAAGVPLPRSDHAKVIAELALAMQRLLAEQNVEGGPQLSVRIGIHSGPVVAGIIGQSKFIYDLWGDTVNIASRMESHGLPQRIQVSEATYRLLGADFILEQRGTILVKGRGEMPTWWLLGRAGEDEKN
jgi:class 3 adenylate cyclase